ncbi:Histidine kinase osmosensor [Elasticomyces elasticus]|nr:Histidine kinase osmosensor [Elasticomyces elasticus]KAK4997200.1 Histidine kinase osmosensor [Elasticomyces elasticus]
MIRIPIREQLGAIILLASLIGLGVISIATWVTNHNYVVSIRSSRLALTASLKAAQLTSNLNLMETSASFVSTRVLIQDAMRRYNIDGNNSVSNWAAAQNDLEAAIGGTMSQGQALLLQAQLFPREASGPAGPYSVLNATGSSLRGTIKLPYLHPNGMPVFLGDEGLGYPPNLYPNLTLSPTFVNGTRQAAAQYADESLYNTSSLLLGPWTVNESITLVSLTMPLINNTSAIDVLGWLTVLIDARLITDVINSPEGLDQSGQTLLIGPTNVTNRFADGVLYDSTYGSVAQEAAVRFVIPLNKNDSARHPDQTYGTTSPSFDMRTYPAVMEALTRDHHAINNAGSLIATTNEAGQKVSVGYAIPNINLCDWVFIVEQSRAEAWEPINHLRNILLACVFGTVGAMMLIALPLAHVASRPIRRLREATTRSVEPPGYTHSTNSVESFDSREYQGVESTEEEERGGILARKEGLFAPFAVWRHSRRKGKAERREEDRRRAFRIPGKVKDRKHFINDELTDLTQTFNEMSDELMMQYEKLEERVQQRTAELEISKKAAEAANESKTLFIANISHELKTPLNGIMGMCAVCMQEDDPNRLKRSLGIIYKSGDLLLNLLTDLLTFSKNQVGQQLSLDEKEFRLRDISSQVLAIFDKQAKDGQVGLHISFKGPHETPMSRSNPASEQTNYGPFGTGRYKDMVLWGDQHRILQVVINLVSNSLKFTPAGGSVVLTIRCLGEVPPDSASRKESVRSRQLSSNRKSSDMPIASPKKRKDTAITINPVEPKPSHNFFITASERAPSPPPGRDLYFEFEVQDTGPGIAEHLQQRIFEPFVQGDLGLSKKYGGTGLGLSICSQLAGLMRGTVSLKSELGHGSTFKMNIPLRHIWTRADSTASSNVDLTLDRRRGSLIIEDTQSLRQSAHDETDARLSVRPAHSSGGQATAIPAPVSFEADAQLRLVGLSQPYFASSAPLESPNSQPAAIEQIVASASMLGKVRVLVAEDNKVNQEVVLRMLKLEDIYDVTLAKDGQEAFDLVKESMASPHPYDLILMDVQMPNLDGLQSTRLIREVGYGAPIVALTAFAEDSNVKDCLESGMNFFLSKPIRRPALKKVLNEYCASIAEADEGETTPGHAGRAPPTVVLPLNAVVNGSGTAAEDFANGASDETARTAGLKVAQDRPISPMSTA